MFRGCLLTMKYCITIWCFLTVSSLFKYSTASIANNNRCSSIPCVVSAASIIERLNTKVDPCENFYEYACGSFAEDVYTPDEKSSVDTTTLMSDKLTEYLVTLMSKPLEDSELEIHGLVKQFYSSCMNSGKLC